MSLLFFGPMSGGEAVAMIAFVLLLFVAYRVRRACRRTAASSQDYCDNLREKAAEPFVRQRRHEMKRRVERSVALRSAPGYDPLAALDGDDPIAREAAARRMQLEREEKRTRGMWKSADDKARPARLLQLARARAALD
jgi:hypothetical protein